VAYASLPKARRSQLHAAFAEWLERSGEGNDEHAGLLAHHYAEAVRPEDLDLAWQGQETEAKQLRAKALAWAQRAAELAIGRYEIDEGLTPPPPRRRSGTRPGSARESLVRDRPRLRAQVRRRGLRRRDGEGRRARRAAG